MQDNEIIDGGKINLTIKSAYVAGPATIAQGRITDSTDPKVKLGPITMRVKDHLIYPTFSSLPFCQEGAPAGACGA